MCAVEDCNLEGVAFKDFGKREDIKTVYEWVCKYHEL
jgi:hypothetical protein